MKKLYFLLVKFLQIKSVHQKRNRKKGILKRIINILNITYTIMVF